MVKAVGYRSTRKRVGAHRCVTPYIHHCQPANVVEWGRATLRTDRVLSDMSTNPLPPMSVLGSSLSSQLQTLHNAVRSVKWGPAPHSEQKL